MFNDSAIHVCDPKSSVDTVFDTGRAKPRVVAPQPFALFIFVESTAYKRRSLRADLNARHQIVNRFAHHRAPLHFVRSARASTKDRATCRCEPVGCEQIVEPIRVATYRENGRGTRWLHQVLR